MLIQIKGAASKRQPPFQLAEQHAVTAVAIVANGMLAVREAGRSVGVHTHFAAQITFVNGNAATACQAQGHKGNQCQCNQFFHFFLPLFLSIIFRGQRVSTSKLCIMQYSIQSDGSQMLQRKNCCDTITALQERGRSQWNF